MPQKSAALTSTAASVCSSVTASVSGSSVTSSVAASVTTASVAIGSVAAAVLQALSKTASASIANMFRNFIYILRFSLEKHRK